MTGERVRTIAWLDGTTRFGRERIGRKGVAISFLKESGQTVPNTFVVTSDAFVGFLTENNLRSRLVRMMESLGRIDAYELRNLSQDAQKLVRDARIPWDMEIDLINSYKRISHESGVVEEDMILRPSVSLGGDREWGLEERIGSLVNVKGEKVTTLTNERKSPGRYNVIWDGTDDFGREVSSGVYFYRLTIDDYHSTKKMLMLK